ncbi:MAG: hypothetical protein IKN67_05260 [Alphaproteobacteria bacterium]|nr:hypothetical protein [Alphaproteobacteria bacterium]
MTLPILIPALQYMGRKYIKNKIVPIKDLNQGEDEILKELQNPNSPMAKDISDWDNGDLAKAIKSPSYKHNSLLQKKVEEYIMTKWK